MLGIDIMSITTGEIFRTFDMPYFSEGKRYVNGWLKHNDLVFIKYNKGTIEVCEKQIIDLVKKCYDDVIADISETQFGEEQKTPNTSEIIRDWKCCAIEEWDWFPVEYAEKIFDKVYKIVEDKAKHESMAYC